MLAQLLDLVADLHVRTQVASIDLRFRPDGSLDSPPHMESEVQSWPLPSLRHDLGSALVKMVDVGRPSHFRDDLDSCD